MNNQHTYLITGAAGFIGANLCRRLIQKKQNVHALIHPASDTWRLKDLKGNFHCHSVDINNGEQIERLVLSIRPSVIYHLATHGAYHYQTDPLKIFKTNIFGTWNLLRACSIVGFHLFVNTGSSSEYGNKSLAMIETDFLEPDSYYAIAKSSQSHLCQLLAKKKDLPIVTFRLFSVYGPYEAPSRLVPKLMMSSINNTTIEMASPKIARDFIHINDVMDIFLQIDKLNKFKGEIFNLGSGIQSNLLQIVTETSDIMSKPILAKWNHLEARPWDKNIWLADISKLQNLLNWRPALTLHQGLKLCLNWFKENKELYEQ